jgi:hypothetical protein
MSVLHRQSLQKTRMPIIEDGCPEKKREGKFLSTGLNLLGVGRGARDEGQQALTPLSGYRRGEGGELLCERAVAGKLSFLAQLFCG